MREINPVAMIESPSLQNGPRTSLRRSVRPAASTTAGEDRLPMRLLQLANSIFTHGYHHITVLSPQRLPRRGAAILVCNHISGLDPLLLQSVCSRAIVWMMASEYYDIRGLNWCFRTIEAIPVQRGGRDTGATRAALRALGAGKILGVFPEGRIEDGPDLLPFQTGVSLMAIKTQVPVFPAYIDGTNRGLDMLPAFFRPNEATLAFGPPVEFDRGDTSRRALDAATDRITQAVDQLRLIMPGLRRRGLWQ